MTKFAIIVGMTLMASPALAQDLSGDVDAGEKAFRQCQTCHVVVDPEGNTLAGRNAKTGPDLYGVVGRKAGHSIEDFRYGPGLEEAAEKGLVWTEDNLVEYLQDPTEFLREYTGDPKARSKMTFKMRSEDDAKDVVAYIHSLGGSDDS